MKKAVFCRDGVRVLRMAASGLAAGLAFAANPTLAAPFSCTDVPPPAVAPAPSNTFNGDWVGPLTLGPIKTWAEFRIDGSQVTAGTAFGILTTSGQARLDGAQEHVELGEHGSLDGPIDFRGGVWTAHWVMKDAPDRQLQLVRRPQTPIPPLPYGSEDVTFHGADGAVIAGTVTAPADHRPHPAVILVTGSVPTDRDYVGKMGSPAHRPFAVLADQLTRQGFVVLRYDSRGLGKSGRDSLNDPEGQFEGDIVAGLALLKGRPDVDPKKVGIIGHSAGGILAGRIAAADPSVAFAVLLESPGLPGSQFVEAQSAAIGRAAGLSDADIAQRVRLSRAITAAVMSASTPAEARAGIEDVIKTFKQEGGSLGPLSQMTTEALAGGDFYKFFMTHDPAADLSRVRQPVLVIAGAKDILVPPELHLPPIRAALKANPQADVCVISDIGHTMRHVQTGTFKEADDSMITIDESVLNPVLSWLVLHTR